MYSLWKRNVCFENNFKVFVKVILGFLKLETIKGSFLKHIRANGLNYYVNQ